MRIRWCFIFLLVAALLAAAFACPSAQRPSQTTFVSLADLSFESEREAERFHMLRAWMKERAVGWQHKPPKVGGNFIRERWCSPKCAYGGFSEERGTAWMSLAVLHYQLPEVFGMEVSIGQFPEEGELALRFNLHEGGKTILGDNMHVTFLLLGEAAQISIGPSMGAVVVDTQVHVSSDGPWYETWREALKKMAVSPQSLEAFAMKQLDALQARVEEALAKDEVMGFDEGPYLGGGIPPERTPRPLTSEEKEREAKACKADIDRNKAFVTKHVAAMHALLIAELPVELLLQ